MDKMSSQQQKALEKRMAEIGRHPLLSRIAKEQAESIVRQALQTPIKKWIEEAVANGFGGVLWFRFELSTLPEVLKALQASKEVQAILREHKMRLTAPRQHQLIVLESSELNMKLHPCVPAIRAVIAPQSI